MNQDTLCDLFSNQTFLLFCVAMIVLLLVQNREGFTENLETIIDQTSEPIPNNDLTKTNRSLCHKSGPLYAQAHEYLKDPLHQYYQNPDISIALPGPSSPFEIPEGPGPEGVSSSLTKVQENSFTQLIDEPILIDQLVVPELRTGHRFPGPVSESCVKKHLEQNHTGFTCQAPGSNSEQQ